MKKKTYLLPLFIGLLLVSAGLTTANGKTPNHKTDYNETTMEKEHFDYIVVGSGPAGAVIANRLSENGKNRVLVLEAGDNNDKDTLIMSAGTNLYAHFPEFFWPGQTAAQQGLNGTSLNIGHGRLSGGGSSINGEMYVRPTPYVLQNWMRAAGEQWSPENATRHFRELENFNGSAAETDVHGYGGDLHIRQNLPQTPVLVEKLVSAMEKATGLPRVDDYNDPRTPIGPFVRYQVYQKPDGNRASASACFLNYEVRERGNLTVLNRATATKVLFSEDKTAKGVEYIHNGITKQAFADKKVIVSAGIHSVQLLMLSGIGPRETLEKFDIPVVYDNKNVGQGLASDAYCSAVFKINEADGQAAVSADPYAKWLGGAFLPDPRGPRDSQERKIQVLVANGGDGTIRFGLLNISPKSRGYSTILSADPLKVISVDYRFLSDPDDLDLLKSMLRQYVVRIGEELHKIDPAYELVSPTKEELADEDKLTQFIQANFTNSFHDQCQLKMGRESEGAVVNPRGEVYGVKNLIVADASIIPYHMDGNTSGPAYLIGATIAEDILSK